MEPASLLEVQDLTVEFATRRGNVRAVRQVNLSVRRGEILGIVGESGSGKSVTSYAVMRILDRAGRVTEGGVAKLKGLEIKPGMPVQLLVKTGERTMLSYLFKPITDRARSAMGER